MMLIKPFTTTALTVPSVRHAATHVALFTLRGGAASVFDMGLAKTRLEGLAYTTVTALLLNAGLQLFSSTPTKLENVPDGEAGKAVKFVSQFVLSIFHTSLGLCFSLLPRLWHKQ